jgi:hypothetical protein
MSNLLPLDSESSTRNRLSFELARAIIERNHATAALPKVHATSFNFDELVRRATAGKGYTADDNASSEAIR